MSATLARRAPRPSSIVLRQANVVLTSAALASVVLFSVGARANCAMPASYDVEVVGNTVTVCPSNLVGRECPDSDGMLRHAADATVVLADKCFETAYGTSCYVDECVPAGQYEYGFAKPYDCCSVCCGTDYYTSVTVTESPAAGCAPDGGAPVVFTGTVPWTDSRLICPYAGYGASGGSGGAGGTSGAGAAGDGGAAGEEGMPPNGSCDCSVGVGSGAKGLVIVANGALALVGLVLRRRRQSRCP